jgi:hypothetical protein
VKASELQNGGFLYEVTLSALSPTQTLLEVKARIQTMINVIAQQDGFEGQAPLVMSNQYSF